MQVEFTCMYPLDTLSRVTDTARRLGLEFAFLQLERGTESCRVRLVLDEADTARTRTFRDRILQLVDLEPVPANA